MEGRSTPGVEASAAGAVDRCRSQVHRSWETEASAGSGARLFQSTRVPIPSKGAAREHERSSKGKVPLGKRCPGVAGLRYLHGVHGTSRGRGKGSNGQGCSNC